MGWGLWFWEVTSISRLKVEDPVPSPLHKRASWRLTEVKGTLKCLRRTDLTIHLHALKTRDRCGGEERSSPSNAHFPSIPFIWFDPYIVRTSALSILMPYSQVCQHLLQITLVNIFNRLRLSFWETWQQT